MNADLQPIEQSNETKNSNIKDDPNNHQELSKELEGAEKVRVHSGTLMATIYMLVGVLRSSVSVKLIKNSST